ncbi:MAG: class II fumarate hydratase [Planctomycetota bacterium]|nr:class II fumarate hydratase [Planctomycetota bacterium]
MDHRIEKDTMGEVKVPADRLWGAQTQRSLQNFCIGQERMRRPMIRAMGLIKQATARVNAELGGIPEEIGSAIESAAEEVIAGDLDDHFPLVVYQTGSGTQSNMNCNEVIANRANQSLGQPLGSQSPVHPNDHVNHAQSTNDSFPTAIHVASACECHDRLLPAIDALRKCFDEKAAAFNDIVKIGRTHLQDATPLTLGQEISGWSDQLRIAGQQVRDALALVHELPIGGTAVGTGLNTRPGYAEKVPAALAEKTGIEFVSAPNKFAQLAGKEAIVGLSGAVKSLATALHKIANDVRWLASGPRCGIGEITIPANEPGSSIMPGKVNPTQSEALTMVCARVIGNDVAIGFCGALGNFELNVYMPVIGDCMLQSIDLLASAMNSFRENCASGIEPVSERIDDLLHRSLMLVTALNPHIGYDKAADVAKTAHAEGKTLREVAVEKGYCSEEEFDKWVIPGEMIRPAD